MKKHVVRTGEHLARIALREGLTPEDIWNDPENKPLADLRKNHHVLMAGDVLQLPDPRVTRLKYTSGQVNNYTATLATMPVRVRFSFLGKAVADEAFEVLGLGPVPVQGKTDGEGQAQIDVTPLDEEVIVQFISSGWRYNIRIGHLDPATEPSGARQRLSALGYLGPEPSSGPMRELRRQIEGPKSRERAFERALRAFQHDSQLPETGVLDDDTAQKLLDAHGV